VREANLAGRGDRAVGPDLDRERRDVAADPAEGERRAAVRPPRGAGGQSQADSGYEDGN
jgi:hypothetical protein